MDIGDSKSFGGRLLAKRKGDLKLQLGASGIYQPYRRDSEQFGLDANGSLSYKTTRVVESTNLSLGVDLSLDYFGLRVRSEYVYFERIYSAGKRDSPLQALGGLLPNFRGNDLMLVVAYRWWKLEPLIHSEYFFGSPSIDVGNAAWLFAFGLNTHLRSNVILKTCFAHLNFYRDNDPQNLASRENFYVVNFLLTWAF